MGGRNAGAAGIVRFASATIAWQANGSGLTGDWSDATHWSGGNPPGGADNAQIAIIAAQPYTVTATDQAAATLLLDMGLGTLSASGSLSVGGYLELDSGTLLAAAGASVSDGFLYQTAGAISLDAASFISVSADLADGVALLSSGALWQDGGLSLGTGAPSDTAPAFGSVTLDSSSGPVSALDVAGPMQIGGDQGETGAGAFGGVGSLELDGGSTASATGISLLNGSSISVDSLSAIAVGSAATVAGEIAIGSDGAMLADIGAIAATVDNAGTLTVTNWAATGASAPGDLLITGAVLTSGNISVADGATLAIAGSLEVDAGSLQAGAASVLSASNVDAAGGSIALDGAALTTSGADAVNAYAVLSDGATWNTGSLAIGPGFIGATGTGAVVLQDGTAGTGGTLAVTGGLSVGNSPGIGDAQLTQPGGTGTLNATGVSSISAASLGLFNGSSLTVGAGSSAVIGSATPVSGAVAAEPGAQITADIATLTGNLVNDGTLIVQDWQGGFSQAPGDLLVSGSLGGSGFVSVNGTLDAGNAAGFAGTIELGYDATLVLETGGMPDAFVNVVNGTANIDLEAEAWHGSPSLSYNFGSGVLTVGSSTLNVGLGLSINDFAVGPDASGGTLVTEAPCYAAGTRILTESGEMPVESLRPGMRVRTAFGRLAHIGWIGHRRIAFAKHPRPDSVFPIRIAAHAIAPNEPSRDLLVSRDHALFIGGHLIPAWLLANGATIARQDDLAAITYYHVELDRHDILLADNLAAESYLDTGNRANFANAPGASRLHPDFPSAAASFSQRIWQEQSAAPLLLDGPRLTSIRDALRVRAEQLGWTRAASPPIAILANGAARRVSEVEPLIWGVSLPAGTRSVRIRTCSFVPAEQIAASGDTRRLGLAVTSLLLGGQSLPDAAFASGWLPPGPSDGPWRWTTGDAELRFAPLARSSTLAVRAATAGHYLLPPIAAAAPRRFVRRSSGNAPRAGAAQS